MSDWQETSTPGVIYHATDPANRQSILQHGLLPRHPETGESLSDSVGNESGIYGFEDPSAFEPGGPWEQSPGVDIWAIDTNGLRLQKDEATGMTGSHYSYDPVPPENLRLHRTASQGSLPSSAPGAPAARYTSQMWHGTTGKKLGPLRPGFFATSHQPEAADYAGKGLDLDPEDEGIVLPVHVDLHNPKHYHGARPQPEEVEQLRRHGHDGYVVHFPADLRDESSPMPAREWAYVFEPGKSVKVGTYVADAFRDDSGPSEAPEAWTQVSGQDLDGVQRGGPHARDSHVPEQHLHREDDALYSALDYLEDNRYRKRVTSGVMPETGTTAGDPNLPLYRYIAGDYDPSRPGIHWTHDRSAVEQMAQDDGPGAILTADHPGHEHVLDWENPADLPIMEREIGGYKYRENVFPEVPVRPGAPLNIRSVEHVGNLRVTSMAERSGVPALDEAIDEFMKTRQGLEDDYRDGQNAFGRCEESANEFADFLKQRGFNAYATSDEIAAFPGYQNAADHGGQGFSYPEHAMVEVYDLFPGSVRTVTIDFTASQYGFTEFPKVEGGIPVQKTANLFMYHVSPTHTRGSIKYMGLRGHEGTDQVASPWVKDLGQPHGNYFFDNVEDARDYAYNLRSRLPGDTKHVDVEEQYEWDPEPDDWDEENEGDWDENDAAEPREKETDEHGYDIYKVNVTGLPVMPDPEPKLDARGYYKYQPNNGMPHDLGDAQEMTHPYEDFDGSSAPARYYTPAHVEPERVQLHEHMRRWDMSDEDYYDRLDNSGPRDHPYPWLQLPLTGVPLGGHE